MNIAATGLAACLVVMAQTGPPRPPGAEPLEGSAVGEDTILLFPEQDFRGSARRLQTLTDHKPHRAASLKGYLKGDVSSLKWNLPAGVLVVLYERAGGRGRQLAFWGSGQLASLKPAAFDDEASRWAWFYVGSADDPPKQLLKGRALHPLGSRPTRAPVPADGMYLYSAGQFRGLRDPITDVTGRQAGELHTISPAMETTVASLQWNLPQGVIVILYGEPDGTGRQLVIWGKGEKRFTRRWGGDKVASWAWFSPDVVPDDTAP